MGSRSFQEDDAQHGGPHQRERRPQPADHRGDEKKGRELGDREHQEDNKGPFQQGHRSNSCRSLVGAMVRIVYGRREGRTCAGLKPLGSVRARA